MEHIIAPSVLQKISKFIDDTSDNCTSVTKDCLYQTLITGNIIGFVTHTIQYDAVNNFTIIKVIKKCKLEIPDFESLVHLTFEWNYNEQIEIPNSVTHITFGWNYNQPTQIPTSVTHITFGCDYNQPTEIPNSVTNLTFGENYNQPTEIPNSVTHLTFGQHYNQQTKIPASVTHITFGPYYNQPTQIPNTVTKLVYGGKEINLEKLNKIFFR